MRVYYYYYYYYYYYLLISLFHIRVFHWSLSDCKSSQVSKTLLSIRIVLNNAVIWMVASRPQNSWSFSLFNNPLVTVSKQLLKLSPSFFIIFFSIPQQGRRNYSFHILSVLFCGQLGSEFFPIALAVDFHWSMSDSMSLQVSWKFLSLMADLNNSIVWMVSIRPLISYSSTHVFIICGPFQENNYIFYLCNAPIS